MEETCARLEDLLERRIQEAGAAGIRRPADVALLDAIHRWRYQDKLTNSQIFDVCDMDESE